MGREAICDCTFNGTTAKVKALLESEELILGGKIRMRAPFRALKDSHLAHLPQGPRTPAQRQTITSALISLYPIDHCYAFGVIARPTSASADPSNPATHPQ
jgi:hypothetical protein